MRNRYPAFTLIEMIIVMAIFSLVMYSGYWILQSGVLYLNTYQSLSNKDHETIEQYVCIKRKAKILTATNFDCSSIFSAECASVQLNGNTLLYTHEKNDEAYVFELRINKSDFINQEIFRQ